MTKAGRTAEKRRHIPLPVDRNMTSEEVATALGVGETLFLQIRKSHKVYAPDGYKALDPENPGKKPIPLWSPRLVEFLKFARQLTVQGTRQFSDDEALGYREEMEERARKYHQGIASVQN